MKRTYIATTQEAKALHDGSQTAIIVKHSSKQPYAIGQEVVVREKWGRFYPLDENENIVTSAKINMLESQWSDDTDEWAWADMDKNIIDCDDNPPVWQSPATMPLSAARTRIRIVSCEAVRVREMTQEQCRYLPISPQPHRPASEGCVPHADNSINRDCFVCPSKHYIIHKLGQQAWHENHYVFYYKVQKI